MTRIPPVIQALHERLGIPNTYKSATELECFDIPRDLVSIGVDVYGRIQQLRKPAADRWHKMVEMAAKDGIELLVVSAYRSADYQAELVQRHLDKGEAITNILRRVAAPGFSEHQSGCAVDVTSTGYEAVEEEFENSGAFTWLQDNAADFGFSLSYPRGNSFGVDYEPWHWCYKV